jgi:hypothetical protein
MSRWAKYEVRSADGLLTSDHTNKAKALAEAKRWAKASPQWAPYTVYRTTVEAVFP